MKYDIKILKESFASKIAQLNHDENDEITKEGLGFAKAVRDLENARQNNPSKLNMDDKENDEITKEGFKQGLADLETNKQNTPINLFIAEMLKKIKADCSSPSDDGTTYTAKLTNNNYGFIHSYGCIEISVHGPQSYWDSVNVIFLPSTDNNIGLKMSVDRYKNGSSANRGNLQFAREVSTTMLENSDKYDYNGELFKSIIIQLRDM